MAADYFIAVLRQRYSALSAPERKGKIREFVAESREQAEFIRKNFPEFFAEAFPSTNRTSTSSSRRAGKRLASGERPARAAKRR